MNNPYTSTELYHLVGSKHPENDEKNYETLKKILDGKCLSYGPNFPRNVFFNFSFNWDEENALKGGVLVNELICFCDIPIGSLGIHVTKYGRFGISFHRSKLVMAGARPVMYVPIQPVDYRSGWGSIVGVRMVRMWIKMWKAFEQFVASPKRPSGSYRISNDPQNEQEAVLLADSILTSELMAFVKVWDVDLDENNPNNFYMEREWRMTNPFNFEYEDIEHVVLAESYSEKFRGEYPDLASKIVSI